MHQIEAYGPPNHYRVTLPNVPEHCFIGPGALARAERFVESSKDRVYLLCKCGRYEFNDVKVVWNGYVGTIWLRCNWYHRYNEDVWYKTKQTFNMLGAI